MFHGRLIVVSSCALLDILLSGSDLMINLTVPFIAAFNMHMYLNWYLLYVLCRISLDFFTLNLLGVLKIKLNEVVSLPIGLT